MTGSHPRGVPDSHRCKECICGIEDERGIWCARLKRIPTPEEVRGCPAFCPKTILDGTEQDLRDEEGIHERDD